MSMASVYWYAYQGLLIKQLRRFLRSWVQSLLPSLMTAGLFLLIFGHLMGKDLPARDGVAYVEFLMPGLIMFAVISNAYSNCTLAFYGARLQRHIEEMLIAPMPAWIIVAGFVSAGVIRGLLAGSLVALMAMPFTSLQLHHAGFAVGVAVMSALLFSLAGVINGVYARSFDDTSLISTFILTPLIYLGGVFYPVESLAAPWADISMINPMLYVVDGFRYGLLGIPGHGGTITFVVLTLLTLLMAGLAWFLIDSGVRIKS